MDIVKNKWKLFITITLCGFIIDSFTKYIAAAKLPFTVSVPVIGDILQWQLIFNKGGVFGINPRALFPSFPVNILFYIFSVIAMILLVFYYMSIDPKSKFSYFGIALIMPGALGNLFDRIMHPGRGVVDFIKVNLHFWPFNPWPIFNMADAFITVGVSLILIDLWIQERYKKEIENETHVTEGSNAITPQENQR